MANTESEEAKKYYRELVAKYGEPTPENRAKWAAESARAFERFMAQPDDGKPTGDFVLDCLYEAAMKIRAHRERAARSRSRVRRSAPAYA